MPEEQDLINDSDDRRKFTRFRTSAFIGITVKVSPLPPFFGDPHEGCLLDLSAGGMAVLLMETIPEDTKLHLEMTFPDHSKVLTDVKIVRSISRKNGYFIALEFLNLPDYMQSKIEGMAIDFVQCEDRILDGQKNVCKADCNFFTMCDKKEKEGFVKDMETSLELRFKKAS